ncbi:MAG TPA: SDR family NAD(P)-dependent oxidoreductase, partial [Kofleriaceae bacterium]|nr:SDR family NAD(P)-dependent oxidoreductase [Kofleriaceae bacterium]
VQAVRAHGGLERHVRLRVITDRALAVDGGAEQPFQAGALGLARVVAHELSRWDVACIDVDPGATSIAQLAQIASEIAATDGHPIAVRGGVIHRRAVERCSLPIAEPAARLRPRGVYLLVGGAGGLGRVISRHLVEQLGARLIWIGRSEPGTEIREAIVELERLGGEVLYAAADAADPEQLAGAVALGKRRFGRIDGAVHTAAVLADAGLQNLDDEAVLRVLRVKVDGLVALHRVLRDEALDFLVVFSSSAAFLGTAGQASYVAASAFQDAYATALAASSPFPVRVIDWGFWGGVGLGARLNARTREQIRARGFDAITPAEGVEAFRRILHQDRPQIVAFKGSDRLLEAIGVEGLERTEPAPQRRPEASAPATPAHASVAAYVRQVFAEVLLMKSEDLDEQADFSSYGVDSIVVMSLHERLESQLGELPVTLLFERTSIAAVAEHLAASAALPEGAPAIADAAATVHDAPPETEELTMSSSRSQDDAIAIVGVGCRYALGDSLDEVWAGLLEGRDTVTEVPAERWNWRDYFDADGKAPGKSYSRWGSFLRDVDCFDPLFFNISPREAECMDPQERLFLETAWAALEDAGHPPGAAASLGSRVGVFVGVMNDGFGRLAAAASATRPTTAQSSFWAIANRVSYYCDFRGPSMAVDTACSSSLTAIHLACESLRRGECSAAIAGGVNLILDPSQLSNLSARTMLARDGRNKSFAADADGFVDGEGIGALVLRRLSDAVRDGDHIYAQIRASAVNAGGRTSGFTVPNPNAQAELIRDAIARAGIEPRSISYIEAHGTGTSLGDPIEVASLSRAFGDVGGSTGFCAIGSIKSNLGHLESAAGVAGVTKVIAQLAHGTIAASLHAEPPNPKIRFETTPFSVARGATAWQRPMVATRGSMVEAPRRAGVSSFGAGGANAHVILEEFTPEPVRTDARAAGPQLIALSARSRDRLEAYAARLASHLRAHACGSAADVALALQATVAAAAELQVVEVSLDDRLCDLVPDLGVQARVLRRVEAETGARHDGGALDGARTLSELASRLQGGASGAAASACSLADVAYTLQTGRAALSVRLALIASDADAAARSLEAFGRGDASGIHVGETARGDAGRRRLTADQIARLAGDGRLDEIAAQWVQGAEVAWDGVTRAPGTRRVPLPGYPFARKRYWFDARPAAADAVASPVAIPAPTAAIPAPTAAIPPPTSASAPVAATGERRASGDAARDGSGGVTYRVLPDGIALVTLDDPANSNMFTEAIVSGVVAAFDRVAADPAIKGIVVTGTGPAFSMGGTRDGLVDIAEGRKKFTDVPVLFRGMLDCAVPVVAAIQGHASGGGLLFGLYADIVVMAREGIYTASFMNYGFTPGMGATLILGERLGGNLAREMMLTGRSYRGRDLEARGASVMFQTSEEVLATAISVAESVAAKPREALTALKHELASRVLAALPATLARELEMHEQTFVGAAVKARIDHQFDRAKPATDARIRVRLSAIDAPNGSASPNGASPNGTSPNGASPNGTSPNGASPNGTSPNGTPAAIHVV